MTRSKHESTATSKLVNLTTKRDSVFMAFSVGVVIVPTPFWRENAVFAYPSWLRLCRVRRGCGLGGAVALVRPDHHALEGCEVGILPEEGHLADRAVSHIASN